MSILFRAPLRASCLCVAVVAALFPPFVSAGAGPSSRLVASNPAADGRPDRPAATGADTDATTLDAIEVRASRDPVARERALTPGAVTVVDGASLETRNVTNLAEALRYVPGLWTESSTGGDAIVLSSRGSNLDATQYDGNGIKLFQDGLPVTTADGNNHNRFLDPAAVRQAIVARGANALTYGASNLGGAIDFLSPTARSGGGPKLALDAGSHGLRGARVVAGGVSGDLDGLLTLDALDRDGYRAHGAQQRVALYANAGWRASDDLALRAYATRIDSDEQLAGGLSRAQFDDHPYQANPSAITGNFQLNVRTSRLATRGSWRIDDAQRLEFGLSYEDQDLYHPIVDKVLVDFDGPGPNPPVEVFSLLKNTGQRTAAGMLRYSARVGEHDLLAGANLAVTHEEGGNFRNDGGRRNGRTGRIDNRSDSVELFMVDRWQLAPAWTLVYGAQGVLTGRDVRSTDLATGTVRNPQDDYSSFNPRLGVIHALGVGEAFASVSRLYEAPTTFELTDDVRGDGSTLQAMHGTVAEAGVRGTTAPAPGAAGLHWDVSVYYARIGDEILSVEDPDAPGTSLASNVARTVHAGIEALAGASIPIGGGGHRIEPLLSATWNAFAFDDDPVYGDNDLPAAPSYALRGEVLYRNDRGFFAGPTFDLVGARYADFANAYRIGPHGLLGMRSGVEHDRWTLFVEVRNLLDRHYVGTLAVRDRAGADDALLQAGTPRSLHAGLRVRF